MTYLIPEADLNEVVRKKNAEKTAEWHKYKTEHPDTLSQPVLEEIVQPELSNEFYIEELSDRFRLYNIKYPPSASYGGLVNIDLSKEIYIEETNLAQEKGIESFQQSEFKIPSTITYHAIISALFENKEGLNSMLVEKIKNTLYDDFLIYHMLTSTMILYSELGDDFINHNLNSEDQDSIRVDSFIGKNGNFFEKQLDYTLFVLLGSTNSSYTNQIYNWLGFKIKLSRLNHRQKMSCGVVFTGTRDSLFCMINKVNMHGAARGVIVRKA